ncbi:hypothetical protein NDU88_002525 [Pleurodeles waltl]|uniref:Uncharacterized protein n=1 Tax=Pleurodeles waltl TaxID=8319 RepID=A0AAV7Q6A4_PLEWA|nr:hypothetical protein NDU88_002525 [Pleurodeles waltl]
MPRKKLQSTRISDYFTPATAETPVTQRPSSMALTKDDLLASLRTFRVELREELTADLKSVLEVLQSDVTSRMTSLQADLERSKRKNNK